MVEIYARLLDIARMRRRVREKQSYVFKEEEDEY